ncbi:MAG: hypothetical protein A2Y23_06345 [Clostridiales bacterium GWB2_37_7]|nr:MAG: hypothetical protein A2Y23_06345 [Clostridiales bacterium GWB2_37_7]
MLRLSKDVISLQACIDSCLKSAQACNKCFKACLEKDNICEMKAALSILVDCAEICYITAVCMAKDNSFSIELSDACAELCEKCASICEVYKDLSCQASVEACKLCAAECRKISIN